MMAPQPLSPQESVPEMSAPDRLLICVLALTAALGTTYGVGLGTFLPFIADDFGTSVPVLGQIMTGVFIVAAIGGVFIGPVADRFGQKRFQMGGACLVILGSLGTAVATGFASLLVVRLLTAFSAAMLNAVTLAATAAIFSGPLRRKAMSWVVAGMGGGPIVGIPFLTLIASLANWRASFVALAVIAAIVLLLHWLFLPAGQQGDRTVPFSVRNLLASYMPLLESRSMMTLYAVHFTRVIAWIGIMSYWAAFLRQKHGLDERGIGWAAMAIGAGYFFGSLLVGGRLGNRSLRPLYALSSVMMGAALFAGLTLPIDPVGATILIVVAALFGSASFVCQTTLLADETPAGRTTTMSANAVFFNLGSAGGGAIGGGLIALDGYTALAVGLAGFSVLSALLIWRPRQREELEPSIETAR